MTNWTVRLIFCGGFFRHSSPRPILHILSAYKMVLLDAVVVQNNLPGQLDQKCEAAYRISSWNRLESNVCWTHSLSKVWLKHSRNQICKSIHWLLKPLNGSKGLLNVPFLRILFTDEWGWSPAQAMPLRNEGGAFANFDFPWFKGLKK